MTLDPGHPDDAFRALIDWLEAFVARARPLGPALEIAAGTRVIAERVAPSVTTLDLVDSSPEGVALARARLRRFDHQVRYIECDVFDFALPAASLGDRQLWARLGPPRVSQIARPGRRAALAREAARLLGGGVPAGGDATMPCSGAATVGQRFGRVRMFLAAATDLSDVVQELLDGDAV